MRYDSNRWAALRVRQAHDAVLTLLASDPAGALAAAYCDGDLTLGLTGRGVVYTGDVAKEPIGSEVVVLAVCDAASQATYRLIETVFEKMRHRKDLRMAFEQGLIVVTLRRNEYTVRTNSAAVPDVVPPEWTDKT